ncbi:MAG TPA: hypothetical protein VIJ62_01970 [Rhizomicrobium sp.]
MPVADFAHNVQMPFFSAIMRAPAPTPAQSAAANTNAASDAPETDSKSAFDDLLDIVNPLQHIPIVSTIYRAITGDTIHPFEQIAGDTLYGGALGFAGSLADTAFTQLAGKSLGDTVMAMFEGNNDTQVAQAAPAATYLVQPAQTEVATGSDAPIAAPTIPVTATASPGNEALVASMKDHGVDANLALRASFAYRQAVAQANAP